MTRPPRVGAVVVAGGVGRRMGRGTDKQFLLLRGIPCVGHSLRALDAHPGVHEIVVVVRRANLDRCRRLVRKLALEKVCAIVPSGPRRRDSVVRGLRALGPATDIILVHDGARPCLSAGLLTAVVRSARRYGSGVAAAVVTDTVKRADGLGRVRDTVDRRGLWTVQTPQAFRASWLREAYRRLPPEAQSVTDDAGAVERMGRPVRLVCWPGPNPKITRPPDVELVKRLLA